MKTEKNLREDIGGFIRKSRQEKALSASQLGELVKLSQQQISRYECGITNINVEMLNLFLTVLDKTWTDFLFSVIAYHSKEVERLKTQLY
ncbi:helix-turn-helix domain-containing protein [Providencia sp. Je.9.19]|uniref:helix-turn-helix domain-containing protein n=1 Tax=Providencia sp. Je.9.19 TaxID=3142844 RepID=UPI003DA956F3